jgi:hypothetical protein
MDIELFSIGFDVEVVSAMGGVMYTRTPQDIRNWCNKKSPFVFFQDLPNIKGGSILFVSPKSMYGSIHYTVQVWRRKLIHNYCLHGKAILY